MNGSEPTSAQNRLHDSNASGSWLVVGRRGLPPRPRRGTDAPARRPCTNAGTCGGRSTTRRGDAHVRVPVLEHPVVPAAVGAPQLVVAVHDAAGVVGVVEVDVWLPDEVRRHLGLAQRGDEPSPQRLPATVSGRRARGCEQRHQHVHVAASRAPTRSAPGAAGSRRGTRAGRGARRVRWVARVRAGTCRGRYRRTSVAMRADRREDPGHRAPPARSRSPLPSTSPADNEVWGIARFGDPDDTRAGRGASA